MIITIESPKIFKSKEVLHSLRSTDLHVPEKISLSIKRQCTDHTESFPLRQNFGSVLFYLRGFIRPSSGNMREEEKNY